MAIAVIIVGLISVAVCVGAGAMNYEPNDITIVSVALIEFFLLLYAGVRLAGVFSNAGPRGPAWEFWGYCVTALIIPVGVVYWALLERTRWSNFILAVSGLATVVMTFRMEQIWNNG